MSDLPEKTIVSKGCHDCPFFFYDDDKQEETCKLNTELFCSDAAIEEYRHSECLLLTHSIKVVKNA